MNISSRQLEAVVQLARYRSFTRAAVRLHITQAGLSAMIGQIEAQLDARLFERTTRSVRLTEAGERFLPVAEQMLDDLGGAVAELGLVAARSGRRLRVGVTPFVAAAVMPAVLTRFAVDHPHVSVHVVDDEVNRIQAQVAEGHLDVAFGSFFPTRSGLRQMVVLRAALSLVQPSGRKPTQAGAAGSARWSALGAAPLIVLPDTNPVQVAIDRQMAELGVAPAERRQVNHIHTALGLVAAGAGVTVLPSFVKAAMPALPIDVLALRAPTLVMNVYALTRAGRRDGLVLQRFIDCFCAAALPLGYLPATGRSSRAAAVALG